MHICVDARNITASPSGIGRYAQALMARLPGVLPEVRWSSIRHASEQSPIDGFDSFYSDAEIGNVIDYTTGNRTVNAAFKQLGMPDLFHSFFHVVPRGIDVPFMTTLHDTIWIDHADVSQPTPFKAFTIRTFASRAIPDTLRRAEHVICVSEATAARAEQWISRDKMTTVLHGVDPIFFEDAEPEEITTRLRDGGTRYIVAIGNDKPYKNLRRLIDAFLKLEPETLNLRLALIGPCDGLREHARSQPGGERVWFLGKLGDADLRTVLKHASVFVFPSLVEGFGLPILEAMASGVPTIVSDLEPMRSVADDAALLFDARSVDSLSAAIKAALHPEASTRLTARGLARAHALTWETTAQKTADVYRALLDL